MSFNLIKRMQKFFLTTLFGGLVALLPLTLLILAFRWAVLLIERILRPLVEKFNTDTTIQTIAIYILAVIAILGATFLIGLVIQTRIGTFLNKVLEKKYLMKIPGYKVARDTVMQFFGKNRSFFKEVVLVDIFNSGTLMTGFITDTTENFYTVFVPTGPNPTSGNIYHVQKHKVHKTTAAVDSGMKSIISCGAGSSEIFEEAVKKIED